MKVFDKGDRVMTPGGAGAIVYKRMAPPTYAEVEVYSVCLDSKKAESEKPPFPSYTGTIVKAEDVREETPLDVADRKVHKVEEQWHYPILTRYGFNPVTKEDVGLVRSYKYEHPSGRQITVHTGMSSDWNEGEKFGYWSDLEPYLKDKM